MKLIDKDHDFMSRHPSPHLLLIDFFLYFVLLSKVIIHNSRGEVSSVEQDTIECVFLAKPYVFFIFMFEEIFIVDAARIFMKRNDHKNMKMPMKT